MTIVFLSEDDSNNGAPWVSMAKEMLLATMERKDAFRVDACEDNVCTSSRPGQDSINLTNAELAEAEIKMLDVSADRFNRLINSGRTDASRSV